MIDNRGALKAVVRHAVELEDDYDDIAPTVAALAASGDTTLVPRLQEALDRFLDEENFYGRDMLLAAAATDVDPNVRSMAIGSIPNLAGNDRAFSTIVLALRDPNEQVRVSAASRLGYTGRVDAVAPLVALAADRAPRVRFMVAYALGRLGSEEATRLCSGSSTTPTRTSANAPGKPSAQSAARRRSMRCYRCLPWKARPTSACAGSLPPNWID